MPTTVTTNYSKERLLQFSFFSSRRKLWFWLIVAVCTLYVFGQCIFLHANGFHSTTLDLCALYVLLLDLLILFTNFILPHFTVKKHKLLDCDVTYTFGETQMQLTTATPVLSENFTMCYNALHKVIKHKTQLYLYISSRQAFIADLSTISPTQEETLKNTFSAALGPKKVRW